MPPPIPGPPPLPGEQVTHAPQEGSAQQDYGKATRGGIVSQLASKLSGSLTLRPGAFAAPGLAVNVTGGSTGGEEAGVHGRGHAHRTLTPSMLSTRAAAASLPTGGPHRGTMTAAQSQAMLLGKRMSMPGLSTSSTCSSSSTASLNKHHHHSPHALQPRGLIPFQGVHGDYSSYSTFVQLIHLNSPFTETALDPLLQASPPTATSHLESDNLLVKEPIDDARREKLYRHRTHVVKEIVVSERRYVASLQSLLTVYAQPALNRERGIGISEDDAIAIFGKLHDIVHMNVSFLGELEKRVEKDEWDPATGRIGDLFLAYGHYFKGYSGYASSHEQCLEARERVVNDRTFASYQERCMAAGKAESLTSLLIMPIQRLPRYKLLLTEVLKATPESHPDAQSLIQAVKLVDTVVSSVNEAIRQAQARAHLQLIQEQLVGVKDLISASRRLALEGLATISRQQSSKPPARAQIYLFNDMIFVAKIKYAEIPILARSKIGSLAAALHASPPGPFSYEEAISCSDAESGSAGTSSGSGSAQAEGEESASHRTISTVTASTAGRLLKFKRHVRLHMNYLTLVDLPDRIAATGLTQSQLEQRFQSLAGPAAAASLTTDSVPYAALDMLRFVFPNNPSVKQALESYHRASGEALPRQTASPSHPPVHRHRFMIFDPWGVIVLEADTAGDKQAWVGAVHRQINVARAVLSRRTEGTLASLASGASHVGASAAGTTALEGTGSISHAIADGESSDDTLPAPTLSCDVCRRAFFNSQASMVVLNPKPCALCDALVCTNPSSTTGTPCARELAALDMYACANCLKRVPIFNRCVIPKREESKSISAPTSSLPPPPPTIVSSTTSKLLHGDSAPCVIESCTNKRAPNCGPYCHAHASKWNMDSSASTNSGLSNSSISPTQSSVNPAAAAMAAALRGTASLRPVGSTTTSNGPASAVQTPPAMLVGPDLLKSALSGLRKSGSTVTMATENSPSSASQATNAADTSPLATPTASEARQDAAATATAAEGVVPTTPDAATQPPAQTQTEEPQPEVETAEVATNADPMSISHDVLCETAAAQVTTEQLSCNGEEGTQNALQSEFVCELSSCDQPETANQPTGETTPSTNEHTGEVVQSVDDTDMSPPPYPTVDQVDCSATSYQTDGSPNQEATTLASEDNQSGVVVSAADPPQSQTEDDARASSDLPVVFDSAPAIPVEKYVDADILDPKATDLEGEDLPSKPDMDNSANEQTGVVAPPVHDNELQAAHASEEQARDITVETEHAVRKESIDAPQCVSLPYALAQLFSAGELQPSHFAELPASHEITKLFGVTRCPYEFVAVEAKHFEDAGALGAVRLKDATIGLTSALYTTVWSTLTSLYGAREDEFGGSTISVALVDVDFLHGRLWLYRVHIPDVDGVAPNLVIRMNMSPSFEPLTCSVSPASLNVSSSAED